MNTRTSGILIHPLSLPGAAGCGDLGKAAHDFLEFLSEAGQSLWQMLPLGPTGYGDSPYQCLSSMAGEPLMIGLEDLVAAGLLEESELKHTLRNGSIQYNVTRAWRLERLASAWERFSSHEEHPWWPEFRQFFSEEGWWLHEFALYMTLRESYNHCCWNEWPEEYRQHDAEALNRLNEEKQQDVLRHKFYQFLFYKQLDALKQAANSKGIKLVGDMPIFVAFDSSDVWAWRHLFRVDKDCNPVAVAGVPPDYFSKTGQYWGNPLYNWDAMRSDDWWWWRSRFHLLMRQCDIIRVDHFRGFEAFWEIPGDAENAVTGQWVKAPGQELFKALERHLPELQLIAEDLGLITPEVEALRKEFNLPGMKVFQFGFFSDASDPFLPHNYEQNCVAYTGTHDNDTLLGFLRDPASRSAAFAMKAYLKEKDDEMVVGAALDALWRSSANWALAPMQDLLRLDGHSRTNLPGSTSGNWRWRMKERWPRKQIVKELRQLGERYGRNM